jgi:hypothetical protein
MVSVSNSLGDNIKLKPITNSTELTPREAASRSAAQDSQHFMESDGSVPSLQESANGGPSGASWFLAWPTFEPEDGGDTLLRNVC